MFYFIYVLLSYKDKWIYTGFAEKLRNRFNEHLKGKVSSTRNHQPLDLIYFEGYKSRKEALARERYLKTGWGRAYLRKVVKNHMQNNPKI